ncbi:MAG: hypothetical protein ACREI9_09655 [Nitrospiraceae bacterium]
MTINRIAQRFPRLVAVIGEEWLLQKQTMAETFFDQHSCLYQQTESDICLLEKYVGLKKLIECYRDPLRDQGQLLEPVYEIHGAAFLAKASNRIDLHVPRGDGGAKNFDVQAEIKENIVNADIKTRKDEFPFNLPRKSEGAGGINGFFGSRPTIDPNDAAEMGIEASPRCPDAHHKTTPESTVIRQILLDGLSQLPVGGCNLVLFGQIAGSRHDLRQALFGAPMLDIIRNLVSKTHRTEWRLSPTGAFSSGEKGEPFKHLSGVLWFRLMTWEKTLLRAYTLYQNPNADASLPANVTDILDAVSKEWDTGSEMIEAQEGK